MQKQREYLSNLVKNNIAKILNFTIFLLFFNVVSNSTDFNVVENMAYDTKLDYTLSEEKPIHVVIVDVDQKSLEAEGRWPWHRDKLAQLTDNLFDYYSINTLGFNMAFAEPDNSDANNIINDLAQNNSSYVRMETNVLLQKYNYDAIFSNAIAKNDRKIILGNFFHSDHSYKNLGDPPLSLIPISKFPFLQEDIPQQGAFVGNIEQLQKHSNVAAGDIGLLRDYDGVIRRYQMISKYNNNIYPSFALSVVAKFLNTSPNDIVFNPLENKTDLKSININSSQKNITIFTDKKARLLIPYKGKEHLFTYISATDVLNKKIDKKLLKNKIILIGATSVGGIDTRITPVSAEHPTVEIHANMIEGILDNKIQIYTSDFKTIEKIMFILIVVVMFATIHKQPFFIAVSWFLICLFSIIVIGVILWLSGYAFPIANQLLLCVCLFLYNIMFNYWYDSFIRKNIAALFGQYVPPELVEQIAQESDITSLSPTNKELSILFSDVRNFTSISEKIAPEKLTDMMTDYLTFMTNIIHTDKGTIDKYIGDCIMAFWGAPIANQQHSALSVHTALEMKNKLPELNKELMIKYNIQLDIGVGINSGIATVGTMGSKYRKSFTVLGDTVNAASRFESLTKHYGVSIIVGEITYREAPSFIYRRIDLVKVSGKNIAIEIFEPLGKHGAVSVETIKELQESDLAIHYYRKQKWDESEKIFKELHQKTNHRLYELYLSRIATNKTKELPKDWDGSFTFTEK